MGSGWTRGRQFNGARVVLSLQAFYAVAEGRDQRAGLTVVPADVDNDDDDDAATHDDEAYENDESGAEAPASYSVRLTDPGEKKLNVIKAIRQVTGESLYDAKNKVESAPVIVAMGLTEDQAIEVRQRLEEAGAAVTVLASVVTSSVSKNINEDETTPTNNKNIHDIVSDDLVIDFLDAIADKILQRGFLTKLIGTNDFDIRLKMESYDNNGRKHLKILLYITCEDQLLKISADRCDEIQDFLIDYLKEKGINDVLLNAGMRSDDPMSEPYDLIDWVHISVNGSFLY